MFGLQRDFALNGGLFMVIRQEPALEPSDLHPVQSGMVTSNRIPGVLNVIIKEVDYRIELQYDIGGRRMLSHIWRSGSISMSQFYDIVYQIADTLHNCRQYMLAMNRFVLHEEYMFISESGRSGSVSLTYVPIRRNLYEGTPGDQMKQFIIRLISYVSELKGDGVQRVLQVCDGELFDPSKLKEVLLSYIHPEPDAWTKENRNRSPGAVESAAYAGAGVRQQALRGKQERDFTDERSRARGVDHVRFPRDQGTLAAVPMTIARMEEAAGMQEEAVGEEDDQEQILYKYRLYVALGGLLGAAVMWRYVYLAAPNTTRLLICVITTAVLVACALFAWKRQSLQGVFDREEQLGRSMDDASGEDEQQEPVFPVRRKSRFAAKQEEGQEPWRWNVQENMLKFEHQSSSLLEESGDDMLKAGEDVPEFPISPATTLLQGNRSDHLIGDYTGAYLRRITGKSGQSEDIPVQAGSFIIGRSPEAAQYVDQTAGVSRSHVELCLKISGQTHVLKDLASTNGTRLNGTPMVPYKEYPLHDGDMFELAGVVYTYYAA